VPRTGELTSADSTLRDISHGSWSCADQRSINALKSSGILFYKRVLNSSNVVLQTLLCLKQRSVNSLTDYLYNINIRSLNVSSNAIKERIWEYNVPL